MKIAFDAKRIYQNNTGLGNYSRTLVESLARQFTTNEYYLLAPKVTTRFQVSDYPNCHVVTPTGLFNRLFKGWWRSRAVKNEMQPYGIDLYHGLSHEIPIGIQHTGIKTVVTMHDLIFERYPHQYKPIDRLLYRYKYQNACRQADHIIAISEQTKLDVVEFYGIDPKKITVCYQSCDAGFYQTVSSEQKQIIQKKYKLPASFFLYVGSVIERKNLLNLCKAMCLQSPDTRLPLVVIGQGGKYLTSVKTFVQKNNLTDRVIFLYDTLAPGQSLDFKDFPAIYQSAAAMIYPSVFEGFGIPILEAMASGIPVITSNVSCMPEVGGTAAVYVDPYQPAAIVQAMEKIVQDPEWALSLQQKGIEQAQRFRADRCAAAVMDVYVHLMHDHGR